MATSIIEEMRKKQQGYEAAMEAINGTKPLPVAIKKKDSEGEDGITVYYYPDRDTFTLQVDSNKIRYESSLGNITVTDTKLILEALNEFFREDKDANHTA